ncbi:phosphotransferase enzyme family protein [Rhodococcus sp. NPDC060176]|uniref:phosphotransferase enzyme family protein n=1 Tax=Rhodococcus sp. NPDC060176 TaxID=3347062 RepID=UPI003668BDE3
MRAGDAPVVIMDAAILACARFGFFDAEVHLVSASENLTFRVIDGPTQSVYSLQLHRPGYHDDVEMTSERQWLRALSAAGVRVPDPINSIEGQEFVVTPVSGEAEKRFATMSHWMPGTIMASVLEGNVDSNVESRYWHQIGASMAAIHNQSSGWVAPAGFRRKHLDVPGLLGDEPHWGRFWEYHGFTSDEQNILLEARDALAILLTSYGRAEKTYSLIHADMVTRNILIDDRGVVSTIDFDDAAYGWHQYDMAAALNNCSNPIDGDRERAFLDGYRTVRNISADDVALLPVFRLIRGMASLGWKGQRPEVEWVNGRLPTLRRDVLRLSRGFLDGQL